MPRHPDAMAPKSRFSTWFKGVRKTKKQTLAESAKALKIDQSTISRWESALALPQPSILLRVCGWSGVSAQSLLEMLSEDL